MPLSSSQSTTEQYIINWALNNGVSSADSVYLCQVAYIESSFNKNATSTDPSSTASGAFGFNNPTWSQYFSDLGSKSSLDNQLAAMKREIQTFTSWYNDPTMNSNIPAGMSREEYMYIKHHDGRGAPPTTTAPGAKIWNNTDFHPTLQTDVPLAASDYYDSGTYDVIYNDPSSGMVWSPSPEPDGYWQVPADTIVA